VCNLITDFIGPILTIEDFDFCGLGIAVLENANLTAFFPTAFVPTGLAVDGVESPTWMLFGGTLESVCEQKVQWEDEIVLIVMSIVLLIVDGLQWVIPPLTSQTRRWQCTLSRQTSNLYPISRFQHCVCSTGST
jgi:hypothetical protein